MSKAQRRRFAKERAAARAAARLAMESRTPAGQCIVCRDPVGTTGARGCAKCLGRAEVKSRSGELERGAQGAIE